MGFYDNVTPTRNKNGFQIYLFTYFQQFNIQIIF